MQNLQCLSELYEINIGTRPIPNFGISTLGISTTNFGNEVGTLHVPELYYYYTHLGHFVVVNKHLLATIIQLD